MISQESWVIIVLGMAYALAEAIQLLYMGYQSRRTANLIDSLLNDAEVGGRILRNGFIGMIKQLKEDPEAMILWDEFRLQTYHAVCDGMDRLASDEHAQERVGELMEISGHVLSQTMRPVINDVIHSSLNEVQQTASKVVNKHIDQEFAWLPKKYRKFAAKYLGDKSESQTQQKAESGLAPL